MNIIMGEIAESMINGEVCELCLMPFRKGFEHGYPVVCASCWEGLSEEEKKHHQKSTAKTI